MAFWVFILFIWLLILQISHSQTLNKMLMRINNLENNFDKLYNEYLHLLIPKQKDTISEQQSDKGIKSDIKKTDDISTVHGIKSAFVQNEDKHNAEYSADTTPEPVNPPKQTPQNVQQEKVTSYSKDTTQNKTTQQVHNSDKFNFEKFFMGNIFNKIGALAIIIGIGIFIKLVSPFIVFTPPMQITTAFIVAFGMIFGACKLHNKEMKNYAEVLMGTGLATAFITTYCSCSYYDLIPIPVAMIMGTLFVISTYFIAQKYRSFSTILIGLFGGYLNPFFINSDISITFLFAYLIFVNIIGIVYVNRNKDKIMLNALNLLATVFCVTITSANYNLEINFMLPVLLWGIYILNDFINCKDVFSEQATVLSWLNFIALICFVNYVFYSEEHLLIASIIAAVGILYGLLGFFINSKNKNIYKNYIYNALLSLGFAVYFLDNNILRFATWTAETFAILFMATKCNMQFMLNWTLAFLFAALMSACFIDNNYTRIGCLLVSICSTLYLLKNYDLKFLHEYLWIFLLPPIVSVCFIESTLLMTIFFTCIAILLITSSRKYNIKSAENYSIVYLITSFVSVFFKPDILFAANNDYLPVLNMRTLQFSLPIIGSIVFTKLLPDKKDISDIIKTIYVSFIYFWLICEINLIFDFVNLNTDFNKWMCMIITGFIYTLNMKILYTSRKNKIFNALGYIMGAACLILLLLTGWNYYEYHFDEFVPFLNMRFFAFIISIITMIFYSKKENEGSDGLFKYLTLIFAGLIVHLETKDFLLAHELPLSILLSASWLTYAGIIMLAGIFRNIKSCKIVGIWITILSIIKIVFFDLADIGTIYKLIEFLTLGIVLMIVSFFYTKNRPSQK